MKKIVLLSLLIGMMGVMAFMGCERPETIDPTNGQPQRANEDSLINQQQIPVLQTDNPGSFLIGEWAVNASMSEGVDNYYKDTLVFANSGIIEKHSTLSGAQYFVLNDTTIRIENTHGVYDVFFRYFPPDGILLYNFWDNTITESVKNIYYERVRL